MGETRLAVEVGLHVAPAWESGVWMVELAEVVDPELIAEEVASSIGVDAGNVGDRWRDVIDNPSLMWFPGLGTIVNMTPGM